ncbi:hypothetical protein HPB51_009589 [Rhipicephalus microplus]|uniref:CCHC-type domain-containing protein n=1 Tax=Rhipicephalus microplus TaxID=6941 RepID=A0A9J6DM36_RHIMP|nr:hypothetical protein HPB51_009589 [Rhipicephalus microplus]
MLLDDHLDSLLSNALVRSSADVTLLRNLHDEATFRINALEGLGASPGEYATVLRCVLSKELPLDLSILYHLWQKEAMPTENAAASQEAWSQVKDLLSFMKVQVEIREESGLEEQISTGRRSSQRDLWTPQPPLPSTTSLAAEGPSPYSHPCVLCTSLEHTVQDCFERLPQEEMRKRLHEEKLCIRCGKCNHFANDCRTARTLECDRCAGRHLTSLCDINNLTNCSQRTNNASDMSLRYAVESSIAKGNTGCTMSMDYKDSGFSRPEPQLAKAVPLPRRREQTDVYYPTRGPVHPQSSEQQRRYEPHSI